MEWARPIKPRQWQLEALALWEKRKRGIIKVVTGGGKTIFAEMAIRKFLETVPNGKVLISVPTISLLDQWIIGLKEDFQIRDSDINIISPSEDPNTSAVISIGVINSLRKIKKFHRPSLLVVDECHRLGTEVNQKLLQLTFDASLGLSATPERQHDDALENVLIPEIGPIIFKYELSQALKDKVVCPFIARNVQVDFLKHEEKEYLELTKKAAKAMRTFEATGTGEAILKQILIKRARVCANATMREPFAVKLCEMHETEKIILFHESVDSANRIFRSLSERGIPVGIYHSKISPSFRRDNLRLFRKGIYRVLVCCRALDEGINVPEASVGIIASGTASNRQRIQRLGRILRPSPEKSHAIVYTLFITQAERLRLEREQEQLSNLAKFDWMVGKSDNGKV